MAATTATTGTAVFTATYLRHASQTESRELIFVLATVHPRKAKMGKGARAAAVMRGSLVQGAKNTIRALQRQENRSATAMARHTPLKAGSPAQFGVSAKIATEHGAARDAIGLIRVLGRPRLTCASTGDSRPLLPCLIVALKAAAAAAAKRNACAQAARMVTAGSGAAPHRSAVQEQRPLKAHVWKTAPQECMQPTHGCATRATKIASLDFAQALDHPGATSAKRTLTLQWT